MSVEINILNLTISDYTQVLYYDGDMSTTMYTASMFSQFKNITVPSCLSFRYNTIQNLTAVLLSKYPPRELWYINKLVSIHCVNCDMLIN